MWNHPKGQSPLFIFSMKHFQRLLQDCDPAVVEGKLFVDLTSFFDRAKQIHAMPTVQRRIRIEYYV